jgi:hypothetical protein
MSDNPFNPSSLSSWLAKKSPSFKAAVEKRMEQESSIPVIEDKVEQELAAILHACSQEATVRELCGSLSLQGELLSILSSVPFPVRLRFLEMLACHSLPLVSSLMDEKTLREEKQQEAAFVYHSIKHAFALKTLYEIFDPAYLSRILIRLERKKNA